MLAIGASAPLIRGPSSQGPHHIEGQDPLGLDPCRPALVQPGRAASGKPDCPLSSVNPGEDWEGDHGDIPDNRPLRIRLGSDFSLATGATGITPQGQATGGNRARIPWIFVIPALTISGGPCR